MKILADTNVLLRALQVDHSDHSISAGAIESLEGDRHFVVTVPQVAYEYWVVATRPVYQNGFGMTASEAESRVDRIVRIFRMHRDERGVFDAWRRLVAQYQILGKQAHDARLVAAMQRHGITAILTFNVVHFARYDGVTAISPHDVVAGHVTL